MKAIKIIGTTQKIQHLMSLRKQALRDGAHRVATRLHAIVLNMEGKTAPEIASILNVHRSKVSIWLENWQQEGMDGILEGHRSGRRPRISKSQRKQLADILDRGPMAYGFLPGSGQVPWSLELSKTNSPLRTITLMFLAFFMNLGSPYSVRRKFLHKPIKLNNHNGFGIPTRILKKSHLRRSGNPLRRRSEFPARPHPLQDMGKSRFATGNTIHSATKHTEIFRHNRVI
jgi:transposase